MQETNRSLPQNTLLPKHIGMIMDGNGRWAKERGLPRKMGHKAGAKAFENTVRLCQEFGIPYLTVYAFSTENWKRPPEEVAAIMQLLRDYLSRARRHAHENVQVHFIGDRSRLSADIVDLMEQAERDSEACTGLHLNIAINYGGREELTAACRALAQKCQEGVLRPEEIDEQALAQQLYTAGQPEPDLILRPSGEQRISNFFLWQCAYSEFVFLDVLWPDFGKDHFVAALQEYSRRNRRFGGV